MAETCSLDVADRGGQDVAEIARLMGVTKQMADGDRVRGLARIRLQGKDVGAFMVLQGHAWSYRFKSDPGPYVREEQAARQARRGVFAQTRPERPYDFRRRHGPCG
jgi:endonuclease YncB( thermonuclease family)